MNLSSALYVSPLSLKCSDRHYAFG